MKQYLLIKRLQVQNANALSSPFTYGFPAVTAFLGFAHALQRHLNQDSDFQNLHITGIGIVNHAFTMQDHQEGYSRTLRLTANPLDKDGSRPSFVEEGRCHFTVSLVLEVDQLENGLDDELKERVAELILGRMKLAGGDILPLENAEKKIYLIPNDSKGLRSLMPGYALIERRDLMIAAMQQGQDALDALHSALQISHECVTDEKGNMSWQKSRANAGWLVPIATGFHALTAAGVAEQQRDSDTPHRFAESLVTLGEFVMPYRLDNLAALVWRYRYDGDFYTCTQQSRAAS
ncbi:MAG: type I-F CRISPR-associated protein Csy2 [Thiothrix lacustris]|uniref:Type I-F CRISPR-associated protein Csy2 n=1 Tax=Thiothrix lacustris TaxID=525917 RepID=A0A1Y1QCP2_9GAMM|nr:MAG: type I-F CRISPR-associated protein Csy2 [Thiothrix lacustris]